MTGTVAPPPGRVVWIRGRVRRHTQTSGVARGLRHGRELHRVPPLNDIIDFLALVDLVDQLRSVVDQPHRRFARDSGPAEPVYLDHLQAKHTGFSSAGVSAKVSANGR